MVCVVARDWLSRFSPWVEVNLALNFVVEVLQKGFKKGKG